MLQAVELDQTSQWIVHLQEAIEEAAKVGNLDAGECPWRQPCHCTLSVPSIVAFVPVSVFLTCLSNADDLADLEETTASEAANAEPQAEARTATATPCRDAICCMGTCIGIILSTTHGSLLSIKECLRREAKK